MNKFPVLILGLCFSFATAQSTYFNKRLNLDQTDFSKCVLQDNNKYLIAGTTFGVGTLARITLSCIDSSASTIWSKTLGSNSMAYYVQHSGSLIKTFDGGYALCGAVVDSTSEEYASIYKFDSNGDTLFTKTYGDTAFQVFYQCKQTRDSGFILAGTTATYDLWHDVWIVKTDSLGNVQWEQHYGLTNFIETGFSVVQTIDGGYFIGGERFNLSDENGDWLLIKTDSLGSVEWERTYGGPYEESCYSVLQTSDGNLIAGGFYTEFCLGPHNGSPYGQPYMIKLDTSGNLLWEKTFGPVKGSTGLFSICEGPDQSIAGAGIYYDDSLLMRFQGLVLKVNSQGDSLWYRNYFKLNYISSDNLLYDIKFTSDQGFIAVGYLDPSLPDTGTIDTWILKLDSMGCDTANCWITLSSSNEIISKDVTSIFPNPFTSYIYLQFDIPRKEKAGITIFNAVGEKIYEKEVEMNDQSISLSFLPPGIYLVSVKTNLEVITRKIVKQD